MLNRVKNVCFFANSTNYLGVNDFKATHPDNQFNYYLKLHISINFSAGNHYIF